MNDEKFKLEITRDIAEIKTSMQYLKENFKLEYVEQKIKLNRILILFLFSGLLGLVGAIIKG